MKIRFVGCAALSLCSIAIAQPVPGVIDAGLAADASQFAAPPVTALPVGDWPEADFKRIASGQPLLEPRLGHAPGSDTGRLFALLRDRQWPEAMVLLKQGSPDTNARNERSETPLTLASLAGQLPLVVELIKHGAELDRPGASGWTPLCAAIARGHFAVVEALLQSGASVNAATANGQLPLHEAAAVGDMRAMRLLVDAGADWRDFNRQGRHAIAEAALNGQLAALKWLARSDADLAMADAHRLNAVHAAALGQHVEALDYLGRHGVPVPSAVTQILIDQAREGVAPAP
jgi:hypothetical protein